MQQEVERVNRLRKQHAAAVARLSASPGLLEIGLVAPPADRGAGGQQFAQLTAVDRGFEPQRGRAEAVLQHDRATHARYFSDRRQRFGTLERGFERLLNE